MVTERAAAGSDVASGLAVCPYDVSFSPYDGVDCGEYDCP
jgi:hypothetical protein